MTMPITMALMMPEISISAPLCQKPPHYPDCPLETGTVRSA